MSELVDSDQDRIRNELIAAHDSAEFIELRRTHRSLVLPLTALTTSPKLKSVASETIGGDTLDLFERA